MADRPRAGRRPRGRTRTSSYSRSKPPRPEHPPAELSKRARELEHRPSPRTSHRPVEPDLSQEGAFHAGFVALVGRPNVGKSTILNRLLGRKLAPTTHKPQTTRLNVLGVLNPPGAQICLLDTPGHHEAKGPLNRFMVQQAEQAFADADVVAYVVEARPHGRISPGNQRIVRLLQRLDKPIVVAVNKVDRLEDKTALLVQLESYAEALNPAAVVPVSAKRNSGLERLVRELGMALPEGEPLYDSETLTDRPERFIVAELIREKVILETEQELPYAAAVTVESFEDERPRLVRIEATIHVERQNQKGIVIGKGGERLRSIGIRARRELEAFLGAKVHLEQRVKVSRDWSSNPARLANLGYTSDGASAGAIPLEPEAIEELVRAMQVPAEEDDP
ncbi:MAG TPA: GTPase Era [Myxococcales bacterium LLY-WYZ-16_1]|nr:GTPase Era [Myxococcales bacterium LLY-WYZ-16_1]